MKALWAKIVELWRGIPALARHWIVGALWSVVTAIGVYIGSGERATWAGLGAAALAAFGAYRVHNPIPFPAATGWTQATVVLDQQGGIVQMENHSTGESLVQPNPLLRPVFAEQAVALTPDTKVTPEGK